MPLPKRIPRGSAKKEKKVIVNRYEVTKKLGHGNYGTAYMVRDRRAREEKEKFKVLKEVPVGDLQNDESLEVKHEADLQRNLDHPSIVRFHDCFVENECFCIVTEYCEGGDLDVKIHEHKKKATLIPEPQVVEWLIQLLLAVQYMHDRRVLHRDLKTRNIFLKNNMIKIGDFGISRILMGTTDMASTFVGTPYYMSPEVLKHEGYNAKSDVWSIGCMLYEMVALEHAFEGQSLMGVMYKIVEGDLPPWPKKYSKELHQVFQKIMVKDPAKRPSASEVLKLPFIAKQIEMLKNTMIQKHQTKEQPDSISEDSAKIIKATKEKSTIEQLKKEADEKRYRNLPPRERMRLEKQRKADAEAQKLHNAAKLQLMENKARYDQTRTTMNPYNKTALTPPWARGDEKTHRRAKSDDLNIHNSDTRPYTAPMRHHSDNPAVNHDSDDDDEETFHDIIEEENDDSDDDERFVTAKENRFGFSLESPLKSYSKSKQKKKLGSDDRPITPMRDKMVYDLEHSSLDWKDGKPDKPDLAETYYSQFEDEFENGASDGSSGEEDDNEGTLVGTSVSKDSDVEDLIHFMQTALDKGDTIKSQTLVDDSHGAFGPIARDMRIKNLRAEAEKKLGKENFEKAYTYLRDARGFSDVSAKTVDENNIMVGLKKIVKNPNDCFIVDQLLFLEAQSEIPS